MADDESNVNRSFKEISFKVPWGVITGKIWGPDDGKPFLGLHGWLDNANTFDRLAPFLPEDIHFVALDFPGHGKSSHRWPGMSYIYFEYIADVKKVVSQLGWERFSIIGHCMDAGIGMLYAGTFPAEVENLVLIDLGAPPEMLLGSAKPADVLAQYATTMSNKKVTTQQHIHKTLESAAARQQDPSTFFKVCIKEDAILLTKRGTRKRTRKTDDGFVLSHDPILRVHVVPFIVPHKTLISFLSKMQCTVLVLEGTERQVMKEVKEVRRDSLNAISRLMTSKLCRTVKGGHFVHLEKPEQVAQEIKEFLALCRSQECSSKSKLQKVHQPG